MTGHRPGLVAACLLLAVSAAEPVRAEPGRHVVLLVDTSRSMDRESDPKQHAVLTAMILGDLLSPQDRLEVVRFYSPRDYPTRETGTSRPCPDDPTRTCQIVEAAGDRVEAVWVSRAGILAREADLTEFKTRLPSHLAYDQVDTDYNLPLQIAAKLLEHRRGTGATDAIVLFLSDGKPTSPVVELESVKAAFSRLGARVVTVGLGDQARDVPELKAIGLNGFHYLATAADLVRTFAQIYNELLGALKTESGKLDRTTAIQMLDYVEEAAFLFYSDTPFAMPAIMRPGGAPLQGVVRSGSIPGKGYYAILQASVPPAGAYRVDSGGSVGEVHYALVQRFSLKARYTGPAETQVGQEIPLSAVLLAGREGVEHPVTSQSLLASTSMTFVCGVVTVPLALDPELGTAPSARFVGRHSFVDVPSEPCRIHVRNTYIDAYFPADVRVQGSVSLTGPARIDFGSFKAGARVCRTVLMEGDVSGTFDVRFALPDRVPSGVAASAGGRGVQPGGAAATVRLSPLARSVEFCVSAENGAGRVDARSQPLQLEPSVPGSGPFPLARIALVFQVEPLSFWERWGRLLLIILGILLVLFVIAGYVVPARFPRTFGVVVSEAPDDLFSQSPVYFVTVPGGRGGFWRSAKVGLSDEGRVVAATQSVIFVIRADKGQLAVVEERGGRLLVEAVHSQSGWDYVTTAARSVAALRPDVVYGVEEHRLYLRFVYG